MSTERQAELKEREREDIQRTRAALSIENKMLRRDTVEVTKRAVVGHGW